MKKFVALFISFILILNFFTPSYASLIDNLKDVSVNDNITYGGDITSPEVNYDTDETDSSKPNAILRMICDAIESALNIITSPIKMLIMAFPTIEDTIWAESRTVQLSFFNSSETVASWGDAFRGLIGSVYNGLRYLVAAIYIIILVYLGIRMLLSSMGRQKAHYKMMLQHWFMGLLLLFAFHWVMAFIIWISYQLTFAFQSLGTSAFSGTYSVSGKSLITGFIINRITLDTVELALIFHAFGAIVSPFWLLTGYIILIVFGFIIFFTYLKRLFTIALLIVLFPLVVLSYVFDKMGDRRAQTFSTWFREFTVNVFLQPIHAFLLSIIAFLFNIDGLWQSPILGTICCFLLLSLIPIGEKQLKTLFQINSNMGPGNGGIAGTVAHAGMALDTLKRGANSLVEMKKNFTNLKSAEEFKKKGLKKAGRAAYNNAIASGKSEDEARAARKQARKDFLKDPKYKAEMKRRTGYTSLKEAKAAMKKRMAAKTLGASAGIGSALATSTSVGDLTRNLVGNGIAGAAIAGTLQGTAEAWKNAGKPIESPELEQAEASAKKGNLDKLSNAEKENMAKVLGIDKSMINEKNRELIDKRLKGRKEALKYGITFDNPLVDNFDPDYSKAQIIKNGKDPDGSGNIKWENYDRAVTKNGTYVRDKRTGEIIKIGDGHPNASDDVIWEEGKDLDHSGFAAELERRAVKLANGIADKTGFPRSGQRYEKILDAERKKNVSILAAHSNCCDYLINMNHEMLPTQSLQMINSLDATYHTIDDARKGLSPERFSEAISTAASYADDMVFDPNNVNSKANILSKISSLEAAKLPISVETICSNVGCSYSNFKQGTVTDAQFQAVTQAVQLEYKDAPKDIQVAVRANILDMEARANDTINNLFGDATKTISTSGIASAIENVNGVDVSHLTSTQLKSYIEELNMGDTQKLFNNLNLVHQAEHIAMPDIGKIINASNNGLINTSVDISSAPNNLASVFNVNPGEKVLVSTTVGPINPTTGMASVTVVDLGNPSRSATFEAPIDTGGAHTDTYAGEISMNASGALQMLRSEGVVDYTFNSPTSNAAQPFYEFELSELQQMCGNTDTTFSIIKYDNICAIMDSNGQFHAVKQGSEQAREPKRIQYTITQNANGQLEYTTSAPTNDIWKLHIAARNKNANPDDVALIKQLLDIK